MYNHRENFETLSISLSLDLLEGNQLVVHSQERTRSTLNSSCPENATLVTAGRVEYPKDMTDLVLGRGQRAKIVMRLGRTSSLHVSGPELI